MKVYTTPIILLSVLALTMLMPVQVINAQVNFILLKATHHHAKPLPCCELGVGEKYMQTCGPAICGLGILR